MKCMPIKRSGRDVWAASAVIEIDEVFVERIASFPRSASSSLNTFVFIAKSSRTASMTRSAEAASLRFVEPVTRPSTSAFAASVIASFLTSRARLLSMAPIPRSHELVLDIDHDDGVPVLREYLRDAVSHRPRADDRDLLHFHIDVLP